MKPSYILSSESTVDLPYEYVNGRNISVLFYTYLIDAVEYEDNMCRDADKTAWFYEQLNNGKLPATSQINEYRYMQYFENLLQKGNVLHISFGSGMTPSVKNAQKAAAALKEKYPEKQIVVIDSTCSSTGYGLLVDMAADYRDMGKSLAQTAELILGYSHNVHHQFFSTDMKFFKRSGRVSGAMAAVATILGICPIMHLNYDGKIVAYDKVRGKQNAYKKTLQEMQNLALDGKNYNLKCFINHSNCHQDALQLKRLVEENFPNLRGKIKIFEVGNIIASHSGPGTVALFFIGCERSK